MRLLEGMVWQERWAHPLAHHQPAARQMGQLSCSLLLELGRLKGWQLAGMGLDYQKCFHLMLQGILFAVWLAGLL